MSKKLSGLGWRQSRQRRGSILSNGRQDEVHNSDSEGRAATSQRPQMRA
jgi:hypothetical protein